MSAGDEHRAPKRVVWAMASSHALLFSALGLARHHTGHNETFDLAFYARMAWGLCRGEFWEPLVDAHIFGLHLSPIVVPLGGLGALFGTAEVLIVAQALALAAASFPIARIGARHLGPSGAIAAALAWLAYPNLAHVAGYEVHPGTMAALPIAWAAWALDRGRLRPFVLAGFGVLFCREDLALPLAIAALLFAHQVPRRRIEAGLFAGFCLLYFGLFLFILHPAHAPAHGSLALHFGWLGSNTPELVENLFRRPGLWLAHLAAPERLLYLPKVLAPFALLSLLAPRWLLPAAPILALNLLSAWPTSLDLSVHYLTPALPFLLAGALEGAGKLAAKGWPAAVGLGLAVCAAHVIAGGTPASMAFDRAAFRPDADTAAARAVLDAIPAGRSVQAPDALLPHLAERRVLRRGPPPETGADFLVLDVVHRRRHAGRGDLLRTTEEPAVRAWLARDDHRLVTATGRYLLLERGHHPRAGLGARALAGRIDPGEGVTLTDCLAVNHALRRGEILGLELVARGPCPADLAIRIGTGLRPTRTDLLFAGWLSPVHLREGERARSWHRLAPDEWSAIEAEGLRVGLIRSSGARPEPGDPDSVPIEVRELDHEP